ncbi:helix-turn-helix domain-containing protein [Actinoallomurus sp. CA-150999]|uniref:helix-turn-helix domain-containing protein n=1 Tax=Actinoallomurus sp. CA-150999 TaxID=3239887 RepID=UPI003D8C9FF8
MILAVLNCVLNVFAVFGPANLVVTYIVALVTSAAGLALIYLPEGSDAYFAWRGRSGGRPAAMTDRQTAIVRQMYEQRDKNGRRVNTVADIAANLGVSRATIYRHLDPEQRREAEGPSDQP